jgi:hypothetical protein
VVGRFGEQRLGAARSTGRAHPVPAPHSEQRGAEQDDDETDRRIRQGAAVVARSVFEVRPRAVERGTAQHRGIERRLLVDDDAAGDRAGLELGPRHGRQPNAGGVFVFEEDAYQSQTFDERLAPDAAAAHRVRRQILDAHAQRRHERLRHAVEGAAGLEIRRVQQVQAAPAAQRDAERQRLQTFGVEIGGRGIEAMNEILEEGARRHDVPGFAVLAHEILENRLDPRPQVVIVPLDADRETRFALGPAVIDEGQPPILLGLVGLDTETEEILHSHHPTPLHPPQRSDRASDSATIARHTRFRASTCEA